MKAYVQAEILKYRHTSMVKVLVLMPLLCVLLAAWLTYTYFAVDSYNWWYIGFYPGLLGILCGMIGGKDRRWNYASIGSLPCSMGKIWDAKVLVGAAVSGAASLLTVVLTAAVGAALENLVHITFILRPSLAAQVAAGLIIWITSLWQIPFCLLLSQKMGPFLMFLVHVASYSVISAAVSLKPWFALLPGAITSRLMCPVLGILPNGLPAVEGQMTYAAELMGMKNLWIGIPAALLWFAVLWWGSRKWFERKVEV